jgi:phospholipid/cholesterol/gamma-HCH transport system substrate-binding protein
MNFKFKYTDKIAGVFVLLSLVIFITSMLFIIMNQRWFERKYTFRTQFADAAGLKTNQDIFFKGFKIGKIKNFNLNRNNNIDAEFFVYERYIDKINEYSVLNKSVNPLTGGSTISYTANLTHNRIADEYSFIPSLDFDEGKLLLAFGEVEKKADAISNIVGELEQIVKSVNSDHNPEAGSIARILVNTADIVESVKGEMKNIDRILFNAKLLSEKIKSPDGLVQRLIDPTGDIMFNSIKGSLDNLQLIMADLAVFSKMLNKSSGQIETLLLESNQTIKSTNDVLEGLKNNPLLKGGIQEKKEQEVVKDSIRDRDF